MQAFVHTVLVGRPTSHLHLWLLAQGAELWFLPAICGSTKFSYNYNYNNTPISGSNGIQKSVTHKVTFTTADGREDDAVEMVDRGENYPQRR